MGISGAALATVVSQICSFILLLYMGRRGGNIRIRYRNFTPTLAFIKEIIGGGTPSLTRQGLASVATILLNVAAGAYGDAAIAGMSIVTRISMFINAFLIGFGQGFQPVCGFNYGAGLYARVRQGFWFCVKVGFFFLLVCAVAGMGYAEEIVSIFRKGDPAVVATGAAALRWQFITYPLGAWIVVSNMMLQTIRKPVRATILSSARQGLFFIPLIFILPYFLGLKGVEMCQAASDMLTFFLAIPAGGDEEEGGGTTATAAILKFLRPYSIFTGTIGCRFTLSRGAAWYSMRPKSICLKSMLLIVLLYMVR